MTEQRRGHPHTRICQRSLTPTVRTHSQPCVRTLLEELLTAFTASLRGSRLAVSARMMRALVADDDRIATTLLSRALARWDFEVVLAHDGESAWSLIQSQAPQLAIVDWMMPALDGPGLCRRIRQDAATASMYVILLTSRDSRADLVSGLESGADDYLIKPVDPGELHARLQVGVRVVALQARLAERLAELEAAVSTVKRLHGLLPICGYCKRIRSTSDDWEQLESYISDHSDAQFSHGICPSCLAKAWPEDVAVP
jgi:sigma-B regulation protein RsbU (phosphoserine phosphatase)